MNNFIKIILLSFLFSSHQIISFAQVGEAKPAVKISNAHLINSDAYDFSPTFYHGGVVFVSSRNDSRKVDRRINEPYFDLFFADLSGKGQPGPPQQFSLKINSEYHEGPVTFNKAADQIFFTRNNLDKNGKPIPNSNNIVKMKIYSAEKGFSEWENVQALPFNDDEYSCMHPSIDADNLRLYFASDMPGGQGGMDIYYTDLVNGEWTKPMNAGTKVNTRFDEVFPFIHNSGILFFSSNKPGGKGGFDLYRLMPDRAFPFALNMNVPFNSKADDLGLIVSDKGNEGFFTSSRDAGMGKDDIYTFNATRSSLGIPEPELFLNTNFYTYDAITKEPIPNVGILLLNAEQKEDLVALYDVDVQHFGEEELSLELTLTSKGMQALPNLYTNSNGNARAKIAANRQFFILAKKDGYIPQQVVYQTFEKADENGIGIALYPIAELTKENKTEIKEGAIFVADKIFYDFDKSFIRVGAAQDLDVVVILMKKYPDMEIDLIAHTDSRGTKHYNQKLSEQRAISAKNYLVAYGIQSHRIRTFGKGETTPRNNCEGDVGCSEREHQYNRRTEIFIRKMENKEQLKFLENQPERIDAMRD